MLRQLNDSIGEFRESKHLKFYELNFLMNFKPVDACKERVSLLKLSYSVAHNVLFIFLLNYELKITTFVL